MANGKVRCGQCEHVFNALENLYEKQPETEGTEAPKEEPADELTETKTVEPISSDSGTEASAKPSLFGDKPSPSIDIKAKMERIAASLSAATQELKTARESNTFQESTFSNKESASEPFSGINSTPEVETTSAAEPEPTVDDLEIAEPEPTVDELEVAEPEPTVDDLEVAEPEPTVDELEVAEPEPTVDELEVAEPVEDLDLMDDFEDDNEEENAPLTDFTTRKVDQDDIDILNSLIDSQEVKQQNSQDDELLDELDNLNKTLSDEDSSLDDEFSGNGGDDFDDLDNGDDLLAELEQLEKDFIDNSQITDQPSDTEDTQEPNVTETIAEETTTVSTKSAEEEVVPSFLTQEDSTSSNPKAMFGWLAGTVVLLVILATQYLHVNSTKLSQNTTFRPLLEALCPMTGCALPLQSAPRKIVTVNHDVRTHTKINNALEIQVTFKNKASFTQAYPQLEIIFSNPRGEVVARRRFIPDEYLTGDIQHAFGIKPNQSQDVKLKIVDPDPGALLSFQFNYY